MDLNVLIVGGGIQGVGLLHDLATRRAGETMLVESRSLASGTSSRSTKLVHGGLRYLEHLGQWPLVREALSERATLLRTLAGVVKPVPFVLPNFAGGRPDWMVRIGLGLYDSFGGDSGLPASRKLNQDEIKLSAPYLKSKFIEDEIRSAFLFYDAQMLDDVIVRLAGAAARRLGARIMEGAEVVAVEPRMHGGFNVTIRQGETTQHVTTKILVNAAGAWVNANLLRWGFVPNVSCILNVGTHLVYGADTFTAKPSESAATLLQNRDGRIVFFIPWDGKWLLGTTESILTGEPRPIAAPQHDIDYLEQSVAHAIDLTKPASRVEEFAGVRTMPIMRRRSHETPLPEWRQDPFKSPFYIKKFTKNISGLSRESVIEEVHPQLYSIYGGKYTTYRALAEKLGGQICRRLSIGGQSSTQMAESWFLTEILEKSPELFKSDRATRAI